MKTANPIIFVDGHIHWYSCYQSDQPLARLWQNLHQAAGVGAPAGGTLAVGFLADTGTLNTFKQLAAGQLATGSFRMSGVRDDVAVMFDDPQGRRVMLIAGRQLATAERLELLAVGVADVLPNGRPIRELIDLVLAAGGVPVIPWATGKWLGARGVCVQAMVDQYGPRQLLLGDSSLRPTVWPMPQVMQAARAQSRAVVPGTDPLPFPGEERWMGTYGFRYAGPFDDAHPWQSMKRILTEDAAQVTPIGRRNGVAPFLYRQIRLRLKK